MGLVQIASVEMATSVHRHRRRVKGNQRLGQICVNSKLIAIAAQDASVMKVRGKGTAFQVTFVKGVVK